MQNHSKTKNRWFPHVTVAAIIENEQKFLLVKENLSPPVLNQPAGHLEENETLIQAVVREVMEETACVFKPEFLIGIYRWTDPLAQTYLRFCFSGSVTEQTGKPLDADILEAAWFDMDAIRTGRLRSPLVMQCLSDYIEGKRFPLSLVSELTP